MSRRLVLFIFLLAGVSALVCPTGYSDDGNGNCQSGILPAQTYFDAYTQCGNDGGYLINIRNAFENTYLSGLIASVDVWLWIGLTCTSSNRTSCVWDNGAAVNATSYTNFYGPHPLPSTSACVAYSPITFQWYTRSCNDRFSFICRITPGVSAPKCPTPTHYFRERCYYSPGVFVPLASREICQPSGAEPASIHSDGENSIVRDIAVYTHGAIPYVFLDLNCTESCAWGDGTNYDYMATGFSPHSAACVSLDSEADGDGSWSPMPCTESSFSVCKQALPAQQKHRLYPRAQVSGAHAHEHINTAVDAFGEIGK